MTTPVPPRPWMNAGRVLGIALVAFALLVGAAIPASAAELMRVTFVRHGQSAGNASGNIDTSTPGPLLTQLGQDQAKAVVRTLGANNYDAVYASTMIRTQLTAGPTSEFLHLPIHVLPGLQEIEAGVFEGTPESQAQNGYGRFPLAWALAGQRDLRIPGSIDGNEFDARVDGALRTVYDNGDRNSVVFSHGGAIMFWTMMNATNLTAEQKLDLLRTAALKNTDYVVVEGNPTDGWRLVNWNGREFGAQPTLEADVQLQLRTLQRQLAAQARNVADAFATLNPAKVLAAITASAVEATYSGVKFAGAVTNRVVKELATRVEPTETVTTAAATTATPAAAARTVAVEAPAATATGLVTTASTASGVETGDAPKPKSENTVGDHAPTTTTEAAVPSTGGTDLTDGNKAVPGATGEPQGAASGDVKETVAVGVGADSGTDGGDTGSDSAGSDGAGGDSE